MSSDCAFSIILPTYNRACIVEQAILSVLKQDYDSWELLIVDDGSTDDTAKHIKPLCLDQRINCTRLEQNCGVSYARNIGVDETTAPYIAFIDSDCLWQPTYLSSMKVLLDNPMIDVAVSMIEGLKWDPITDETEPTSARWVHLSWKLHHETMRKMWIGPSQLCIKRDKFLGAGGFDVEIENGEDADLWGRLYAAGISFAYYPHPLVVNRVHSDSAQKTVPQMSQADIDARQERRRQAREVGGPRRRLWTK